MKVRVIPSLILLCVLVAGLSLVNARSEDISVHFEKSFNFELKGDNASALNEVLQVLQIEPGHYTATLRAGWLCYLLGRFDDSIVHYRKAISIAPDAIEPRNGLLLPLNGSGRWKETEAAAGEALQIDPMSYLAISRLAFALYSMGKYDQAAKQYMKILKLYPSDIEMQVGLAWTYLKMNDKKSATEWFSKVLKVRRSNPLALEGMEAIQK